MKPLFAFIKKELTEALRGGKLYILLAIFVLFGLMNPILVQLTPLMMDMLSESLSQAGINLGEIPVNATASWAQFFKNIPMALIVFVVLGGNTFTKEYQRGTLVLLLTKGLKRSHAVIAKTLVLILGWTAGYFLCFGITYAYNQVVWGNSELLFLTEAVLAWWLAGVFAMAAVVFFSALFKSTVLVLLGTGGCFAVSYLLSIIPFVNEWLPTALMSVASDDIIKPVAVTVTLSLAMLISAVPIINKKEI